MSRINEIVLEIEGSGVYWRLSQEEVSGKYSATSLPNEPSSDLTRLRLGSTFSRETPPGGKLTFTGQQLERLDKQIVKLGDDAGRAYFVQISSPFVLDHFVDHRSIDLAHGRSIEAVVILEGIPEVELPEPEYSSFERRNVIKQLTAKDIQTVDEASATFLQLGMLSVFDIRRINMNGEVLSTTPRRHEADVGNLEVSRLRISEDYVKRAIENTEATIAATSTVNIAFKKYVEKFDTLRQKVESKGLPRSLLLRREKYEVIPFTALGRYMSHVVSYEVNPVFQALANRGNSLVTLRLNDGTQLLIEARVSGSDIFSPQ